MAIILLIRHGENDSLSQKKLAGRQTGIHLNEAGRQQAERVAELLANAPIKAIYSSPLERALETAGPLAVRHGIEVKISRGLEEAAYGDWQGKSFKSLRRLKLWKEVHKNPSQVRFPGGESILEIRDRIVDAVERIQKTYEAKELVACFSHADILRIVVSHYLMMPLDEYHRIQINTASITVLDLSGEKPRLTHINQIDPFVIPSDWLESPKSAAGK